MENKQICMSEDKMWTGERLETFVYCDTTIEHLHRYAMVLDLVKNKTVLDIASGEGYGSNLLSQYADMVFGVDIDQATIEASKKKYTAKNLEFKVGSADAIPLKDQSVDVLVSFETLEHHDKHDEMMKEIKRVLKPNGILVMSTPDKRYYSDENNYNNPFHVKELYLNEFKELIGRYFANTRFYFQNMFKGSLVVPEKDISGFTSFDGDYGIINSGVGFNPTYLIAIASDATLTNNNQLSCFVGQSIAKQEMEDLAKRNRKELRAELKEEVRVEIREEAVNWVKSSWTFRIGNVILTPFKIFRK
jgi:ubiquinone/menaquinone biosynthesis C-methylase UbiE